MNTDNPNRIGTILKEILRSACPEAPIDIHMQNEYTKWIIRWVFSRAPQLIIEALTEKLQAEGLLM